MNKRLGLMHDAIRQQLLRFLVLVVTTVILAPSPVAAAAQQADYAGALSAYVARQREQYRIPGMAIAIVRGGEVEFAGGFGNANDAGAAVTADTPFLLASLSKSVTAVAVMQLVEAGKLNLDDPVQAHLPWFDVDGEGGSAITVRHLFHHTSGFSELAGIEATLRPDGPDALAAGVRDLAKERLGAAPGTAYEYSNLNYDTLGLLVQELSGQSYEAYVEEHIFAPLSLNHSYTSLQSARAGGAASGYYPFFGAPLNYDNFMPYSRATLPAGGLWSSASDFGRYLIALLDEDAPLLSPASVDRLFAPGVESDPGISYAMGWQRAEGFLDRDFLATLDTDLNRYEMLTTLFHEGDWANYKSVALLLPALDYGVVVLMNSNDPTVASALRFFAWDVTLIANGGEAQYFPPAEDYFVRNGRWVLGVVALLLLGSAAWSLRYLRRARKRDAGAGRTLAVAGVLLGIDLAVAAYLFLRLLPDNAASLRTLLGHAPDLGLLALLILLLTTAWAALRTGLFANVWAQQRRRTNAAESVPTNTSVRR